MKNKCEFKKADSSELQLLRRKLYREKIDLRMIAPHVATPCDTNNEEEAQACLGSFHSVNL